MNRSVFAVNNITIPELNAVTQKRQRRYRKRNPPHQSSQRPPQKQDQPMAHRNTSNERRLNELDHNIERIFDVRKRLGKGAYGIVWKATDKRQKDTVALKKIFDAFRDETDAQRTYREVIFLRAFRHHPNIIRILDTYKASNNLDFYLVFEYMESDLHNVIKKGDILKDIHKRFIMYQLINAIKYMHSGNVIHRDLKPSNILIDSKCRLKVADFGLARTLSTKRRNVEYDGKDELEKNPVLTDYVATRWYRAPEILVASRKYTKGIDMWSLGCILGEMIRQKPLFQGTSTVNQIEKIVNALPDVTSRDIESIGPSFGTVLLSKKIVRDRRCLLDDMLRNSCDDAVNMVKALLVLDPDCRLTASGALAHPYVNRFRTASADMEMRSEVHPPLEDDVRYCIDEYRTSLYEMIVTEPRPATTASQQHSQSQPPPQECNGRSIGMSTRTRPTTDAGLGARTGTRKGTGTGAGTGKRADTRAPSATESSNVSGLNTIRKNYTQAWAEKHYSKTSPEQRNTTGVIPCRDIHGHSQTHGQAQAPRPAPWNHICVGSPVAPPAGFERAVRPIPKNTKPAVQHTLPSMALRRELAAVAATAPRFSSSLWPAPVDGKLSPRRQMPRPLASQQTVMKTLSQRRTPQHTNTTNNSTTTNANERLEHGTSNRHKRLCQCLVHATPKQRNNTGGTTTTTSASSFKMQANKSTSIGGINENGVEIYKPQPATNKPAQHKQLSISVKQQTQLPAAKRKEESSPAKHQPRQHFIQPLQHQQKLQQRQSAKHQVLAKLSVESEQHDLPDISLPRHKMVLDGSESSTQMEHANGAKLEQQSISNGRRRGTFAALIAEHGIGPRTFYTSDEDRMEMQRERALIHKLREEQRQQMLAHNQRVRRLKAEKVMVAGEACFRITDGEVYADSQLELDQIEKDYQQKEDMVVDKYRQWVKKKMEPKNSHLMVTSKAQIVQQNSSEQKLTQPPCNKKEKLPEQKQSPGSNNCSESNDQASLCYKWRLSHLEEEMARCKRQLLLFMEENEDLLCNNSLRHHLTELQRAEDAIISELPQLKSALNMHPHDASIYLKRLQKLRPDQLTDMERTALEELNNTYNLDKFKEHQDKEKQLQVQEFLMRDESNAYELPDLSNVYKTKSFHSFGFTQIVMQAQQHLQQQEERQMQQSLQSKPQESEKLYCKCKQNENQFNSSDRVINADTEKKWPYTSQISKESFVIKPPFEPMRPEDIKEVNFYEDFQNANCAHYRNG